MNGQVYNDNWSWCNCGYLVNPFSECEELFCPDNIYIFRTLEIRGVYSKVIRTERTNLLTELRDSYQNTGMNEQQLETVTKSVRGSYKLCTREVGCRFKNFSKWFVCCSSRESSACYIIPAGAVKIFVKWLAEKNISILRKEKHDDFLNAFFRSH